MADHHPHVAFGPCTIEFTQIVDYEPPAYLLHELLPKVEEEDSMKHTEVTDAVISALDLGRSSWPVVPIDSIETEKDVDRSHRDSRDFEFAQLVLQGAFVPIQLNATALDPIVGFSSSSVVRGVQELAEKLKTTAHERPRSLVSRSLSHVELAEEAASMKRVMMSNHFINVLAWQRLQELLMQHSETYSTERKKPLTPIHTDEEKKKNTSGMLRPSISPWSTDYSECSVSCPEQLSDPSVPFFDQLTQYFKGVPVKSFASSAQQTDDSLRSACAGVIRITSPFADICKETDALHQESVIAIANQCFGDVVCREERPPAWEIAVNSSGNLVDTFFLSPTACRQLTFGRDPVGFSSSARAVIGVCLASFTDRPKLLSPLHLTTTVLQSDDAGGPLLDITAWGRNGLRVLGKRHLLAGDSLRLSATADGGPSRLQLTPDLSIVVTFRPYGTESPDGLSDAK